MPLRSGFALPLAAVLVAATLGVPASATHLPPEDMPPPEPTVVMSFLDTGINPYHATFRDEENPWSWEHPSTYIEGYPKDAIALDITLDEPDWKRAVQKDCALWKSVEPGKLYWFPKTKIIGAITFHPTLDIDCANVPNEPTRILDNGYGHGTMVASKGASKEYGACKECRIVAVQIPHVPHTANIDALRWTADQPWVDLQSNSWASLVPLYDPTATTSRRLASPALVRAAEETAQKIPSFWATMNGAMYQGGTLGHPSALAPHLGPSIIAVGAHDSGYVTPWAGSGAHLASDGCDSWAASHMSTTISADTIGFGTSAATPFVAGGAANLMLESRRLLAKDLRTGVRPGGVLATGPPGLIASGPLADGVLTVPEMREILLKTATERPTGTDVEDGPSCGIRPNLPQHQTLPVRWDELPEQFPEYAFIGYGAVDRAAMARGSQVLRGAAAIPDRADTDRYFVADAQVRSAKYAALTEV
ncbi:MAG TPA: S8/S53 family peptidase [Actinomycetota bacterium]|nr:S8/S53 family peptidase [Actinomycetota bacterium]